VLDLPAPGALLEFFDAEREKWVVSRVDRIEQELSLVWLSLGTEEGGADTVLVFVDEPTTSCLRPCRSKPAPTKLPEPFHEFTFVNSPDGCDGNLLILLHGLGDNHKPFSKLAQTMALPQTAYLAINGPEVLPFDNSYSWFPSFQDDGEPIPPDCTFTDDNRRVDGLIETRRVLRKVVEAMVALGFSSERIVLLGFSQGGTACLDFIAHSGLALGGVCVIAAIFLPDLPIDDTAPAAAAAPARGTPLLLVHGDKDTVVPLVHAKTTLATYKKLFPGASAELKVVPRKGHSMIGSAAEMRSVMTFLAERMYLRNLELEDRADVVLCA
jgi:predicted esterase